MEEKELQTQEREGAGMRSMQKQSKKERVKSVLKKRFSAKRVSLMAVFVALSFAVSLLDFPIFPATPFLKLDFGNTFILLIAFLLGPVEGVIVCVLKEVIRIPTGSTGGVGELANMFATSAYILLPSIIYQYKKGLKFVIPSLAAACLLGTGAALITNRYINFPLYMGAEAAAFFAKSFYFILAFNLIKTVSVSILTLLLYKRLSNFLKNKKI